MLRTLAVQNYRSLRRLVVPLTDLNVVTGPNGSGKSSLYRALRLLADASRNGVVAALAREGGLPATLWAGPEKIGRAVREGRYPVQGTVRTEPVALRLGFGSDATTSGTRSTLGSRRPRTRLSRSTRRSSGNASGPGRRTGQLPHCATG